MLPKRSFVALTAVCLWMSPLSTARAEEPAKAEAVARSAAAFVPPIDARPHRALAPMTARSATPEEERSLRQAWEAARKAHKEAVNAMIAAIPAGMGPRRLDDGAIVLVDPKGDVVPAGEDLSNAVAAAEAAIDTIAAAVEAIGATALTQEDAERYGGAFAALSALLPPGDDLITHRLKPYVRSGEKLRAPTAAEAQAYEAFAAVHEKVSAKHRHRVFFETAPLRIMGREDLKGSSGKLQTMRAKTSSQQFWSWSLPQPIEFFRQDVLYNRIGTLAGEVKVVNGPRTFTTPAGTEVVATHDQDGHLAWCAPREFISLLAMGKVTTVYCFVDVDDDGAVDKQVSVGAPVGEIMTIPAVVQSGKALPLSASVRVEPSDKHSVAMNISIHVSRVTLQKDGRQRVDFLQRVNDNDLVGREYVMLTVGKPAVVELYGASVQFLLNTDNTIDYTIMSPIEEGPFTLGVQYSYY